MRVGLICERLESLSDEDAVGLLHEAHRGASLGGADARSVFLALGWALFEPRLQPRRPELGATARRAELHHIADFVIPPLEDDAPVEDKRRIPDLGRGRPLTLGERKSLGAHTRPLVDSARRTRPAPRRRSHPARQPIAHRGGRRPRVRSAPERPERTANGLPSSTLGRTLPSAQCDRAEPVHASRHRTLAGALFYARASSRKRQHPRSSRHRCASAARRSSKCGQHEPSRLPTKK